MPPGTRLILGVFEDAVARLNSDIQRMGTLAQESLGHAVGGLMERNSDLCNRAIADDEIIDDLEKQIDREGIEIIMRFGPVAHDLRRVISTMKAASAIERISDHAVSFARRARQIITQEALPEANEIRKVYHLAAALLKDAVGAFCGGDLQAALLISGRDEELDSAYHEFNRSTMARMKENPARIPEYVNLLFCARFIERIGDQSVNIAEGAVYLLTAMDIRHGGELPPVK